jgi:hypothetical protein
MTVYSLDQINVIKANVDSPAFDGIPTAPTAPVGTNTTQLATTAFALAAANTLKYIAGTQSYALQIPDSTVSGGNTRGSQSIDLQVARSSAAQVASGFSSMAMGNSNIASGSYSVSIGTNNTASSYYSIAIGGGNTSSGSNSVAMGGGNSTSADYSAAIGYNNRIYANYSIAMGNSNTASSTASVAIGQGNSSSSTASVSMGYYNTASGSYSVSMGYFNTASSPCSITMGSYNTANSSYSVAMGANNSASGNYSVALINNSSTNYISSKMVMGTAFSGTLGAYQMGQLGLGAITTDATATVLKADTSAAGTSNQCTLQNNNVISFTIEVVARNTSTGMAGRWEAKGLVRRGANASTTALVGTPTVTLTNGDAEAWITAGAITIAVNTTYGFLSVSVTGAAATTIHWMCKIKTVEVV